MVRQNLIVSGRVDSGAKARTNRRMPAAIFVLLREPTATVLIVVCPLLPSSPLDDDFNDNSLNTPADTLFTFGDALNNDAVV